MFEGTAGIRTSGDKERSEDRLLTWSLLWMCPWESGVHDKTKEDESYGREHGVRVAADLVWTVVSSAGECSLPAANLSQQ